MRFETLVRKEPPHTSMERPSVKWFTVILIGRSFEPDRPAAPVLHFERAGSVGRWVDALLRPGGLSLQPVLRYRSSHGYIPAGAQALVVAVQREYLPSTTLTLTLHAVLGGTV